MASTRTASSWLVTGAAGFLGSHVVEQLPERQIPVIGLDNLSGGNWQHLAPFANHPLFKFVCKDIRDEASPPSTSKPVSPTRCRRWWSASPASCASPSISKLILAKCAVERAHLQADTERLLRSIIGCAPHGDLCRGLRKLLLYEGVSW